MMIRTILTLIAALVLAHGTPALAQNAARPQIAARGAFFALSVADVDSATAWYRDKLGFRVVSRGAAPNGIAKFALLEAEGTIIEIIQHRDGRPRSQAAPATTASHHIHGIFKIGLHVADIDAVHARLQAAGVPIEYALTRARDIPLRTFSVRDAEGNMVQFFGT